MTSLERVQLTLQHKEPDRVPFDLGSTVLTGIHKKAYVRLREFLGLTPAEVQIEDICQQLALVEEKVKQMLQVDVRSVNPKAPTAAIKGPWEEGVYWKLVDEWGIEWWMPRDGGLYFDMRRHPLAYASSVREIEQYPWPDPTSGERFEQMGEQARYWMEDQRFGYVLGRHAAGIFETASWMRGIPTFLCDLIRRPALAQALLEKVTQLKMQYWEKALETVGKHVMIVSEADDLATQDRLMISPEQYRKWLKPYHRRLFEHIKKKAQSPVKIFYHCCGAIKPLLPDLIEAGIDILNPVQVSAKGMDTKQLKRQFGKDLVFWGGGIDTQHVLPHGSKRQIFDEVRRRIEDLAPGGGFVFATVHNIQADVPPENIVAMWEALQRYGSY